MDSPVVMDKGSQFSFPEPGHLAPVKQFHRGEPVALGITQMFIGITGIVFGILINLINTDSNTFLFTKTPYWSGILYIISGSLTVAAARNPKILLMKCMLAMNTISAIAAGLAIIFLSLTLNSLSPFNLNYACNYNPHHTKEKCDESQNVGKGILFFLTVINILEFCISISVASFGCKMFCRDPFTETVMVVYQNVTPSSANQHPTFDCKQPAIHP